MTEVLIRGSYLILNNVRHADEAQMQGLKPLYLMQKIAK